MILHRRASSSSVFVSLFLLVVGALLPHLSSAGVLEPIVVDDGQQVDALVTKLSAELAQAQGANPGNYAIEIVHVRGTQDNPHLRRLIEQLTRKKITVDFRLIEQKDFEGTMDEITDEVEHVQEVPATYATTFTKPNPRISQIWQGLRERLNRLTGTANGLSFLSFIYERDPGTGKIKWKFKHDPTWFKLGLYTTLWAEAVFGSVLHYALKLQPSDPHFWGTLMLFPALVFPFIYQKPWVINPFRMQGITVLIDPNAPAETKPALVVRQNKIWYNIASFLEYLHNGLWITGSVGGVSALLNGIPGVLTDAGLCTYASTPFEYATAVCSSKADALEPQIQAKESSGDAKGAKDLRDAQTHLRSRAQLIQWIYWNAIFPVARNTSLLYAQIAKAAGKSADAVKNVSWVQYPFPAIGTVGLALDFWRSRAELPLSFKNVSQDLGFWTADPVCRDLIRVKRRTEE